MPPTAWGMTMKPRSIGWPGVSGNGAAVAASEEREPMGAIIPSTLCGMRIKFRLMASSFLSVMVATDGTTVGAGRSSFVTSIIPFAESGITTKSLLLRISALFSHYDGASLNKT